MSKKQALFVNSDGRTLYWAGAQDAYDEHSHIVFTYARSLELARSHFLSQYSAIDDLTVMCEEDLALGQVVASAAQWSVLRGDAHVLSGCLKAYQHQGYQPPAVLLMNAAGKGYVECFDLLRPHFTLAFMEDDGRTKLAQMVGKGGSLDILSRVERHFATTHFQHAMEFASIAQHQPMIAALAEKCSAHNVLDHMRKKYEEEKYRALERWITETQRSLLVSEIDNQEMAHCTDKRRKL